MEAVVKILTGCVMGAVALGVLVGALSSFAQVGEEKVHADVKGRSVLDAGSESQRVYTDLLTSALAEDSGFQGIDENKRRKLVDRVSALAHVRDTGTAEDHVELMESWGGTFPHLPVEASEEELQAYAQRLLSNWQGKDHPYGISQRYVGDASIRVASRGEPGEANIRPSGKMMSSSARITSIKFDDDVKALASEGTLAIEVKMPIVLNNGLEREEGVLMLWSQREQQWLPYMRFARQEKESPGDRARFYLSFF